MNVIPKTSRKLTENVNPGRFVFLLDGGSKPAFALRSRHDEPVLAGVSADFVIRFGEVPEVEDIAETSKDCLVIESKLSWKLGADQIRTANFAVGAAVVLSNGLHVVVREIKGAAADHATVLSLQTGTCKTVNWGRSLPIMPWSIVDSDDRVYARWIAPKAP